MQRTHHHLTNVCYEWKEDIDVLVNPDSSYYLEFFTKPMDELACSRLFAKRSLSEEARSAMWAFGDMVKDVIKSKVLKVD